MKILEYIESNQNPNQFIDTGIYATSDIEIFITTIWYNDSQQNKYAALFGMDEDKLTPGRMPSPRAMLWINDHYDPFKKAPSWRIICGGEQTQIGTGIFDRKISFSLNCTRVKIDYYTEIFTPPINEMTLNDTIGIFNAKTAGQWYEYPAHARIYSVIIIESGKIVRNFIPVKDDNDVVCMFDKVSKKYFYNQGTGEFIAGPEKSNLPNYIGVEAFAECSSLTNVQINSKFSYVNASAFCNCKNLNFVDTCDNSLSIGDSAFYNCEKLDKIDIGNSINVIDSNAFRGCSSLTSVDRFDDEDPNKTFDIVDEYAFAGSGLKKINLALRSAATDTWWGDYCFASCDNLEEVNIISSSYTSRGMFEGCKKLSSVNFKNDFTSYVYPYTFKDCTRLRNIELHSQLWFITKGMFQGCSSLNHVGFKSYSQGIIQKTDLVQSNAFNGCKSLSSIEFPESLSSVNLFEQDCLSNISNLKFIYFRGLSSNELTGYDVFPGQDDLKYNNPFFFEEPYYAFYDTYNDYVNAFGEDVDVSEKYFNEEKSYFEKNAKALSNVIVEADARHIPVIVYMNIDNELATATAPGTSKQNIYKYTGNFDAIFDFPFGAIHPANQLLKAKIGSSTIQCKYIFDDEKEQEYIDVSKQQLSAILIDYHLDIGYFQLDEYDDPSKSQTEIESKTQTKLTKFFNTVKKITCGALSVINKEFFNSTTIPADIKTYSNYGIFRARFKNSAGTVKRLSTNSIQFDSYIKSENQYYELTDKEMNDLYEKADEWWYEHPEEEYPLPSVMSIVDLYTYSKRKVNNLLVTLMKKSDLAISPVDLDSQFFNSEGELLNDIIIREKTDGIDYVDKTGLFGLRKDCKLFSKDFPGLRKIDESGRCSYEGKHFEYEYKSSKYDPPIINNYESDRDEKETFMTGAQCSAAQKDSCWYYNIKEAKQYADVHHLPIYCIYSSAGCDPCQHYLNKIHRNASFQEWALKQNIIMCRLEAEKPKKQDKELAYCEDELARNALNYIKAGSSGCIQKNAMDQEYFDTPSGQTKLPPPCMIFYFKKKDGSIVSHFDYSFHGIDAFLNNPKIGVEGTIQYIQRLCLNHFDNNDPDHATYTVGVTQQFNKYDYKIDTTNPYKKGENLISLNDWDALKDLQRTPENAIEALKKILSEIVVDAPTKDKKCSSHPDYIGDCLFDDIDWILKTWSDGSGSTSFMSTDDPDEYNKLFDKWFIQIGNFYYKMSVDKTKKLTGMYTPCSMGAAILYKYLFTQKEYKPIPVSQYKVLITINPIGSYTAGFDQKDHIQYVEVDIDTDEYDAVYLDRVENYSGQKPELEQIEYNRLKITIPANTVPVSGTTIQMICHREC